MNKLLQTLILIAFIIAIALSITIGVLFVLDL
jgi:hypothetical protein